MKTLEKYIGAKTYMYTRGLLPKAMVKITIKKGIITNTQYEEIVGED